jgi:signal transduction histidine kinase
MPGRPAGNAAQLREELDRLRQELDEQRRLNAILTDSAEQFIRVAAHDLKNPLAAIKVNVQALKRAIERMQAMEPAQTVDRLTRIELSVDQAQEAIAAARARLCSGAAAAVTPRRQTLDLVALARGVADEFREKAGRQRVHLQAECRVLVGEWDKEGLVSVVRELLDNALKFSPISSRVILSVAADAHAGAAIVRCQDNGIGIPARDVPHVCERLYRGENVLGCYKGAGLGLYQAQAVVAGHGGWIDIESVEGQGSLFSVVLPLQ